VLSSSPPSRHLQVPDQAWEPDAALVELVRGRLEGQGPPTALAQLVETFGLPAERISAALTAIEVEDFALAGWFTPGGSEREWCERRLLARIHRYTVKRLRAEIEPVSARD
jgi:ATP-dependent helicase Lhr and Lhr-like helicase